jgi:2-dehydro-3-deoxyphosphogluconate aldolase/(4S)-4-hydroxy-2-oxoglutarate aldolase
MKFKELEKRLIPVAVIRNELDAIPLAEALIAGGLNIIEVTLRTDSALASIQALKKTFPDMVIGAGTILDHTLIPDLVDMGVDFGVSPGLNKRVIEEALKHGLTIIPGVNTPSEIEQARDFGLTLLKFFPAEAAGGAAVLKAWGGPYGHTNLKFIPTGGINMSNLQDYLKITSVAAVGGSWFVADKLLNDKAFGEVTRLTKQAVELTEKK